ncbi:acetylglutamate kinase [Serpentinicella alkaliphila]|uniref:Acetylglutamate kinase n=1 Tax=Serpentinicella alkaliphila TaxID=1734049 RepID=A0A4V2T3T6_9FIRM|nr:acetylglutamate kinase [Serpentinicella alkaliphila]QUH24615.1 acetylglutamate kinase [Serpentinicella alkaliphila]TCQ02614.1 N-acetylglutamate kinase [Serpentinicella alkaliphila]
MNITPCQKADVLIEALPYIKSFYNQTVVIKYGGNAMINEELKRTVIQDIVLMKFVGMNPVVVHGGGPEITDLMKVFGKEPEFVDGLRVTDKETMEITEMALVGKVSREIVSLINLNGVKCIGISGKDGNMIKAKQKDPKLGLVGEIDFIDTEIIETVTQKGYIPVISPIGVGENGETYNINADEVAGNLAAALQAKKLVLITDVQGVMMDYKNPETIISKIKSHEINGYIENGVIQGGMIPKIKCCLEAVSKGVERAHIIDGRKPHSILLEIFTDDGIGTMITE